MDEIATAEWVASFAKDFEALAEADQMLERFMELGVPNRRVKVVRIDVDEFRHVVRRVQNIVRQKRFEIDMKLERRYCRVSDAAILQEKMKEANDHIAEAMHALQDFKNCSLPKSVW